MRDTGSPSAVAYTVWTELLRLGAITLVRRPAPGGGKEGHRTYEITRAGRALLARCARLAA